MRSKNKLIVLSISLIAVAAAGVSVAASVAAFERYETIGKNSETLNVGSLGAKNTGLYLQYDVWTEVSGYKIWMLKWNDNKMSKDEGDTTGFAWVEQPNSDTVVSTVHYLKFDFDTTFYNRVSFHRVATADGTPTTFADRYNRDSGGKTTNSTSVLSKPETSNVYHITSYSTSGNYGFLSGGTWENSVLTA